MIIHDTYTTLSQMSKYGHLMALSSAAEMAPEQVFTGLATLAAKRVSRALGVHVEFIKDALIIVQEHVAPSLIVSRFRAAFSYEAERQVGFWKG